MPAEIVTSPRFIKSRDLVTKLLNREKDYIGENRLHYSTFVKDVFTKINLKTIIVSVRVALPVIEGQNHIDVPENFLDWSSIAAPDENGKLRPMVLNSKVKVDTPDLSLAKRCGCDCGCEHDYCKAVRNYEVITGVQLAKMPDQSMQEFKTSYRKIIMSDGSYVEEKTIPVPEYTNNVHTGTVSKTITSVICKLDIEPCGCIKKNDHNRRLIEDSCDAMDVHFECGCAVRDPDAYRASRPLDSYNVSEDGSRIFLPSNFRQRYIVLRYYANTKTRSILIPFMAAEAMMSGIKHFSSKYDTKANMNEKLYWENQFTRDLYNMREDMVKVDLIAFLHAVLGVVTNS